MRPPPNYFSRSVQRKVFVLVGLLLLVVVLMKEARRAENWHWLWYLQGQAVPAVEPQGEVDTRLRERGDSTARTAAFGPLVMGAEAPASRADEVKDGVALPAAATAGDGGPLEHAQVDAWARLLEELPDERRSRLLRGLRTARDGAATAQEDRAGWPELVSQLDSAWQDYLSDARTAIQESAEKLTAEERQRWEDVLAKLQGAWDERWEPALSTLAEATPPSTETREALDEVQAGLDAVFLKSIEDNTVFRPTEQDAWFRLLERLARGDATELRNASLGTVGFVQLFKQPQAYRGKLVTVKGTVRRGYYREAPENLYGIAGYYMLWIQPVSVNSPIVIYCLELPDQFPDVRAMEAGGQQPELDEEVEVTGFFFKRWAYRAQDGTRLAPLLLAKTVAWNRGPAPLGDARALPGAAFWTAMLSGTCLFGIVVAAGVYWVSRRSVRPTLRDRLSRASKQGHAP